MCKRKLDDAEPPATEPPAAPPFAPPEAGAVQFAELWYFVDDNGVEQGPHGVGEMRAWYEAGYFLPTCKVAASYYGEIPETYFQIQQLWKTPATEAFMVIITRPVEAAPDVRPEFQPCAQFGGARGGYCFKLDLYGVGYYLDKPPEIDAKCTRQALEKDKEEREATRRRLNAAVHFSGEGPS